MSFTDIVVSELYELTAHKSCCRKALLCGLLFGALRSDDGKCYKAWFYRERDALLACDIINASFSSGETAKPESTSRGGHKAWTVKVSSRALCSALSDIDNRKKTVESAVGFRCSECMGHFLKGVFLSTAALSKPKSGYHLEISLPCDARADMLSDILADNVARPGRISRGGRVCLYYKSNSKISDLLYFFGAPKASFDVTNISIERDIRNNENRATNCVTSNISRSVSATRRHIDAINYLIKTEKLARLDDDLEYTARLRVENDSASLSELAALHEPPISKSGLNARLAKILAIAQDVEKQGTEQ